jgi:hypothetical protein
MKKMRPILHMWWKYQQEGRWIFRTTVEYRKWIAKEGR